MTDEDFEGKGLVELLDMLEPVSEPPAISMWPQTQGWTFLFLALLVLAVWLWLKWRERHRANAYRRAALAALQSAGDDPVQIAAILRRTAMTAFARDEVAGLTGGAWLRFLDGSYSGSGFDSDLGRQMLAAPYQVEAVAALPGLGKLARDWVKGHRRATT